VDLRSEKCGFQPLVLPRGALEDTDADDFEDIFFEAEQNSLWTKRANEGLTKQLQENRRDVEVLRKGTHKLAYCVMEQEECVVPIQVSEAKKQFRSTGHDNG
jgi:hypothetical protein